MNYSGVRYIIHSLDNLISYDIILYHIIPAIYYTPDTIIQYDSIAYCNNIVQSDSMHVQLKCHLRVRISTYSGTSL